MSRVLPRLAASSLLPFLPAQENDTVPTIHTRRIPPGAHVDLDTGIVLPAATWQRLKADLHFDRDGQGFFLAPVSGAIPTTPDAELAGDDWQQARQRVDQRSDGGTWFVRTDRGSIARVTLAVVDSYSTASAVLRWVVNPPQMKTFLAAPTGLTTGWERGELVVGWHGDQASWLVEIDTGGTIQKLTCKQPPLRVPGLEIDGVHHVTVRGLAGGDVTLPAMCVQHGKRQAAARGSVAFPDSWYRTTGGLSLLRGEPAIEDADVVFYLYGVYVPDGGVLKVGRGERAFHALTELPEAGHLPSYDRLDDHDVLAVRLRDGRHAKLWLRPSRGGDLRNGMDVQFAFLPDGRRTLLAPPKEATFTTGKSRTTLQWLAVTEAKSYRVAVEGLTAPLTTTTTNVGLEGLPANRFLATTVTAIGADGDESDPLVVDLHTFDARHKVGRFTLQDRKGFAFAADDLVAIDDKRADCWITNSAGGGSSLSFATPHGGAVVRGLRFGDLPSDAEWRDRVDYDNREPDTALFVVKTGNGGIACVRIRATDASVAHCDYVFRPAK